MIPFIPLIIAGAAYAAARVIKKHSSSEDSASRQSTSSSTRRNYSSGNERYRSYSNRGTSYQKSPKDFICDWNPYSLSSSYLQATNPRYGQKRQVSLGDFYSQDEIDLMIPTMREECERIYSVCPSFVRGHYLLDDAGEIFIFCNQNRYTQLSEFLKTGK